MRPIRLLFVSDHLGHAAGRIHGATRYFLDVLPRLQTAPEIELHTVFLRGSHQVEQNLREKGVKPQFLQRGKYDPRAINDLVTLIRTHEIDLLHCAGMKGILTGRTAAHKAGIPCIAHLHDMIPQSPIIRMLMIRTRQWSQNTITISHAVAEFAKTHFKISSDSISILRNGIDLELYNQTSPHTQQIEMRKALGIPQEAQVWMTIGRLHPIKGQQDAIETLRRNQDLGAWLVLVGDGPERQNLQAAAKTLPVVFAGQRNNIADFLSIASLLLMPSKSEGLGLSAMEALAAGVPVVAYATGGLQEVIVHEQSGLLVPANNLDALASATRKLATDPEMHQRLSKQARESSRTFSVDLHVQDLLKRYQAIMQANRPNTP